MFGREARYFSEIPDSFTVNETVEDALQTEILLPAIEMQDKVFEVVKMNMQTARKKVKARKQASRAVLHTFAVGEKVLRRNIRSQQRKGGKLDSECLGPFTLTFLRGKSADLLGENGVKFSKINLDHLVPFVEEKPHIPHKLKMHTSPLLPEAEIPTSSVLPEAEFQKSLLLPEAEIPTSSLLPEAEIPTSLVLSEAEIQKSPVLPEAEIPISPVLSEAEIQKSPVLPEAEIPISPVLSEAEIQKSPVLPEAEIPISPVLSEAEIQKSPVLPEAEIHTAHVLTRKPTSPPVQRVRRRASSHCGVENSKVYILYIIVTNIFRYYL
ncbi:hypothetical protein AMEX_G24893 [Astyanax mexicanus]|uniref:Uncharacterized protein n=1 Tax=Astyanax mexicanus TaxID=7994 RepID=A0A8T2KWG1_ASTMX|nr:hypothetical protein AMEX_G24893 [Astyanax mexicanus]